MSEAAFSFAQARVAPGVVGPDAGRVDADAPLTGLAGSGLAGRFRLWHGLSGRRYLFSVFPLGGTAAFDLCPRYEDAVVLAVDRSADGTRALRWVGQSGAVPDLVFEGGGLRDAVAAGANEIHMHLLAPDRCARDVIVADIRG